MRVESHPRGVVVAVQIDGHVALYLDYPPLNELATSSVREIRSEVKFGGACAIFYLIGGTVDTRSSAVVENASFPSPREKRENVKKYRRNAKRTFFGNDVTNYLPLLPTAKKNTFLCNGINHTDMIDFRIINTLYLNFTHIAKITEKLELKDSGRPESYGGGRALLRR